MEKTPTVSIVMPVYNGTRYIRKAVESILSQSFNDYEFIIIDDGSKDSTATVLKSYKDSRIKIITHLTNKGLISTLNEGINLARGKYIARMDADDISLPTRLEVQSDYLNQHKEVGMCGSWIRLIGDSQNRVIRYPTDCEDLAVHLFFDSYIAHPTVMIRKEILTKNKFRFNSRMKDAEDYDLWVRLITGTKIVNIPSVLYLYRQHKKQVSRTHRNIQKKTANAIRTRQIKKLINDYDESDIRNHLLLCNGDIVKNISELIGIGNWVRKLEEKNRNKRWFNSYYFNRMIAEKWLWICRNHLPIFSYRCFGIYIRYLPIRAIKYIKVKNVLLFFITGVFLLFPNAIKSGLRTNRLI